MNLSAVTACGQVGTGESAAKLLAQNGISIKISQDGNIKLFYHDGNICMVF